MHKSQLRICNDTILLDEFHVDMPIEFAIANLNTDYSSFSL